MNEFDSKNHCTRAHHLLVEVLIEVVDRAFLSRFLLKRKVELRATLILQVGVMVSMGRP